MQAHGLSNSLAGYGGAALVTATLAGSCRFSDNYCRDRNATMDTEVMIVANSIIAANNRIEGNGQGISLDLQPVDERAFSVLGNIVSGDLHLNGAPLPPPWQPLNVLYMPDA